MGGVITRIQDYINENMSGLLNKWFPLISTGAIIYAVALLILGLLFIGWWSIKINKVYMSSDIAAMANRINKIRENSSILYGMVEKPFKTPLIGKYFKMVDSSGVLMSMGENIGNLLNLYENGKKSDTLTGTRDMYDLAILENDKIYRKLMYLHYKNMVVLTAILDKQNTCGLLEIDYNKLNELTDKDIMDMKENIITQADTCNNVENITLIKRYDTLIQARRLEFQKNGYSWTKDKPDMSNPIQAKNALDAMNNIKTTTNAFLNLVRDNYLYIINYFRQENTEFFESVYHLYLNPDIPLAGSRFTDENVNDTKPKQKNAVERLIGFLIIIQLLNEAFILEQDAIAETNNKKKEEIRGLARNKLSDIRSVINQFKGFGIDLLNDGNRTIILILNVPTSTTSEGFTNYNSESLKIEKFKNYAISPEELHFIGLEIN